MSEVELTPEWLVMAHTIEYDPTWPDGKPNYCAECDEALPEGNERCGHNAALLALVDRAATLARLAAADRDTALREAQVRSIATEADKYALGVVGHGRATPGHHPRRPRRRRPPVTWLVDTPSERHECATETEARAYETRLRLGGAKDTVVWQMEENA